MDGQRSDAQRKIAAFVTRGTGDAAELLVFWHAGGGVQIPAGTVEPGETFGAAGRREAVEETGLADLELVASLGIRSSDLPDGMAAVNRRVTLQTRPGSDGPKTSWSVGNVWVTVVDERDGCSRIVYTETDLDADLARSRWSPRGSRAGCRRIVWYDGRNARSSTFEPSARRPTAGSSARTTSSTSTSTGWR